MTIRLSSAEIVELVGPDAAAFAHSQFSSNVKNLAINDWQWSAWLDAQGRVQHLFALLRPSSDRLIAWQPRGSAEAMSASLKRYVMRAKVSIEARAGWSLSSADIADPASPRLTESGNAFAFELPGLPRRRALLSPNSLPDDPGNEEEEAFNAWTLADIEAGLPWVAKESAGQLVAATLGLLQLGAASLDKGCYPGQEIVARLHYRGGNKRHCYVAHIPEGTQPSPGEAILSDQTEGLRGLTLYSARDATGGSSVLVVLPDAIVGDAPLRLESGATIWSLKRIETT